MQKDILQKLNQARRTTKNGARTVLQNCASPPYVTRATLPFFLFGGFFMSEPEFKVSGFQWRIKGSYRADKGKKHNYPAKRKTWD
jgi:hypothetical protein